MKIFRYFLLSILIIFTTSCAQFEVKKPANYDHYDSAVVEVSSDISNTESEVNALSLKIVDELKRRELFKQIDVAEQGSAVDALRIKVVIDEINRTGPALRIAQGLMARSNEVKVNVYLLDNLTQQELVKFRLIGYSPERTGIRIEWPWGSVEKSMEKVSKQLGRQLAKW